MEPGARTAEPAAQADHWSRRGLVLLSVYWLGISSVFAGLGVLLSGRLEYEHLVTHGTEGSSLFQIIAIGSLLALLVQPTIGTISDYTHTRWGRRRPYIVVGALLDLAFLAGIAVSNAVLSIAAFYLLLQLSANSAQGPYQGYVPDMVPARQVGFASALVGLMQVMGNVLGYGIGALGPATNNYAIATMALGVLEVSTMAIMILSVKELPGARDRQGRSWLAIAREAWGLDILRERSFIWLVSSRLFVLMASQVLLSLLLFYLARCFGFTEKEAGGAVIVMTALVAVGNAVALIPAARLADRIGRKPVITLACGLGAAALVVLAVTPALAGAYLGVMLLGVAMGMFLAVDWALLSSIVPRISSGRYMGISNVATASAGVLAIGIAGTFMDLVGGPSEDPAGPRAAMLLGAAWFGVGALLLRKVTEPRRPAEPAAAAGAQAASS